MFNFINPWMLAGLAGISLPILAHLLSKRKYDVVNWGAMQFLELSQNARRKLRLEQLLLLLLRIGLIALLAFAMARPWAEGSWTKAISTQSRDVVIIVDGSYSMGWEGRAVTPHKAAIQAAHHLLNDLKSGDSVALIDAREQARLVIEPPTRDFAHVRKKLNELPAPSGTANLAEAMRKGVQILSRTSNLAREIVVITDGQAIGWRAEDKGLWAQYDDLLDLPSVRPRTWVMNVGEAKAADRVNFSVEKLQLNREMTAVGYPIRIKTKIRGFGGKQPTVRKVYLEVDGQRLDGKTIQKTVKPGGEESVEFEYQFKTAGSHRVSVLLDRDNLPGDNRADASLTVTEALPVLLVDGDPNPRNLIQSETVFAHSALTPENNPAPWVKADAVPWTSLDPRLKDLKSYEAVYLCNVPRLTDGQIAALREYVANGGGLFITLGNKIDSPHYNDKLLAQGRGLMPAELVKLEENKDESKKTVQVVSKSLEVPWIQRFRAEHDGGFCDVRFSHRWSTKPAVAPKAAPAKAAADQNAANDGKAKPKAKPAKFSDVTVLAKLNTGDPLLMTRKVGRGRVVLMTSAIDGDWSTFPAKDDYTPFLHEVAFFLASSKASRNVDAGVPLVLEVPETTNIDNYVFFGPGETTFDFATGGIVNGKRIVRLDDTSLAGVYVFRRKTGGGKQDTRTPPEYFVVNFDRSESDLTPLNEEQLKALAKSGAAAGDDAPPRMTFVKDRDELMTAMYKDNSRSEFWWVLLLVFLVILVFEVAMARRMVQGGHAVAEDSLEPAEAEATPGGRGPPPLKPAAVAPIFEDDPPPRRRSVVSRGETDLWEPTA
jgi:Aerotolerance regulator N-terminal/von Willebrand factor type A domain